MRAGADCNAKVRIGKGAVLSVATIAAANGDAERAERLDGKHAAGTAERDTIVARRLRHSAERNRVVPLATPSSEFTNCNTAGRKPNCFAGVNAHDG
jgi:hypothetical protein